MADPVIFYSGPIVLIQEAERRGLKRYFTGKVCRNGHVAERYISTWRCIVCTTNRVLDWQNRNPEKKRLKQKRYEARHPQRQLEASRRDHETARQRLAKKRAQIAGRPRPTTCDICHKADIKIVWDHCHEKGTFRGWLCNRCNKVLGMGEDLPALFRKMADYLERDQRQKRPERDLTLFPHEHSNNSAECGERTSGSA